jgi:DNA-binding NtrC family response regulator
VNPLVQMDGRGGQPTSAWTSKRVLIVDDDPDVCALLEGAFTSRGFEAACFGSAEAALSALQASDFDLALVDVRLDGMDGIELCERIAGDRPGLPVVMITASAQLDTAVAALRAGAIDFITKSIDPEALGAAAERALRRHRASIPRVPTGDIEQGELVEIIGESAPMRELKELLARVAQTDVSVLLTGESGTGRSSSHAPAPLWTAPGRPLHRD